MTPQQRETFELLKSLLYPYASGMLLWSNTAADYELYSAGNSVEDVKFFSRVAIGTRGVSFSLADPQPPRRTARKTFRFRNLDEVPVDELQGLLKEAFQRSSQSAQLAASP